jgi:polar amino acid transport system substrate-binding protein
MNMKKILGLFILIFLLTLPQTLLAAEKVVSVVTLDGYAPYCMLKEDPVKKSMETIPPGQDSQKLRGYSWDVVRDSFHAMGYTIKLKVTPWKRAMKMTKSGKMDILMPAGKNEQRQKIFYYSQEPINEANFVIYVNKDSNLKWDGLQSLHGKDIAVRRGFNYGNKWIENKGQMDLHQVNSIMTGFKLLDAGRVDGFAGYDINWNYALKQAGKLGEYKSLPPFGKTVEYAVGLKSNARATQILEDFDKGKRKIIEDGTFKEIENKWLGE